MVNSCYNMCKYKTLSEMIENAAKNNNNTLSTISFNGKQSDFSYNELYNKAKKYAGGLKSKNVNKTLLLCIDDPGEFISTLCACFLANIVAVPLEPLRINEIKEGNFSRLYNIILQHSDCAIITDDSAVVYYKKMAEVCKNAELKCLCPSDINNGEAIETLKLDENACALIQYSSGSTGSPKGVMLSHKNIIVAMSSLIINFEAHIGTRAAIWAPLFHNMGLVVAMAMIMRDANAIVAHPGFFVHEPTAFVDILVKKKIEITISNNFGLDWYFKNVDTSKLCENSLSNLKALVVGSEVISEQTLNRFVAKFKPFGLSENCIRPTYGLTEAGLAVSSSKLGEPLSIYDNNGVKIVGNGRALPNYEIKIIDNDGNIVEEGQSGEICISSDAVTIGYLMNNNSDSFENGWFKTGDIGFIINGELYISGRKKDMIIIRGHNYMISDLEKEMFESLNIEQSIAALSSRSSENMKQEQLYMFVAIAPNDEIDKKINTFVNELMKKYGFSVDYIVFVDSIDKTATGKINRPGLFKMLDEGKYISMRCLDTSIEKIYTNKNQKDHKNVEKTICAIVSDITKIKEEDIDINVPYYEYIPNSVNQYKLMSAINEKFSTELSPAFFRTFSTISEIAEELKNQSFISKKDYLASDSKDIAITGLSFRLPGADNIEELWDMLDNGRCLINDISQKRKELTGCHNWTGRIAEVNDVDMFDAKFFDIPEKDAAFMDPHQRLILETSYEALEDSAEAFINSTPKNIGTYISIGQQPYLMRVSKFINENGIENVPENALACNLMNIAAARINHYFNFNGEAVSVDTACSSFLNALHLAKESIRSGKLEGALVSSAHYALSETEYLLSSKAGFLSKVGESRPFDKDASGAVMGEGVISVFVEPLEKAINNKKHIYAVIKGSAINNDGYALSIMAPSLEGQYDVLRRAYNDANIDPSDVSYIEAHGTGTTIGDPIEIHALGKFFKETNSDPDNKVLVGSIKSNVGHLLTAASGAGLAKILACFKNKKIAPSVNIVDINPVLKISKYSLNIANEASDWNVVDGKKRTAGITSLGLGGTNVHMILEEGVSHESKTIYDSYPFVISAKTREALEKKIVQIKKFMLDNPDKIADICFTLCTGRMRYGFCAACVVKKSDIEGSFSDIVYSELKSSFNNPVYIICGSKTGTKEEFDKLRTQINTFSDKFDNVKGIVVNGHKFDVDEWLNEDIFTKLEKTGTSEEDINFQKRALKLGIGYVDADVECSADDLENSGYVLDKICQLYLIGAQINWGCFKEFEKSRIIHLPSYPFNRKSYWI